MAVTYTYGYTVQAYINWDAAYKTDPNLNIVNLQYYPSYFPNLYPVQAETINTSTSTKFEVQKGFGLVFHVRLYQIKNDGGIKTYYALKESSDLLKLKMNFESQYFSPASVGASTNNAPTQLTTPTIVGGSSMPYYTFQTTLSAAGATLTQPYSVTLGQQVSANDFSGTYGGDTSVTPITLVPLSPSPIMVIGEAVPIPTYPQGLTTYIQSRAPWKTSGYQNAGGGSLNTIFDKCKKQWYVLFIGTPTPNSTNTASTYNIAYYTSAVSGDISTYREHIIDMNHDMSDYYGKNSPRTVALQTMQQIALGDCIGQKTLKTPAPSNGDAASPTNTNPPAMGTERFNPPTHMMTKTAPFAPNIVAARAYVGSELMVTAMAEDVLKQYASSSLGKIIQDPNGAATLNTNPDHIKNLAVGKGKTAAQWGFRFMYNPTTFSYSTASNNAVDWTLGSSDPSILLQGNQTVSVELYLNRIVDMTYLLRYPTGGPETAGSYGGGGLSEEQAQGILNRGTEYDIEYLYRVLNGDPLTNSLLLSDSYRGSGVTADFGYTTGTPCWLYLNDNLRYFGSVASMQVNHMIFNVQMIPMLSVVNITFTRYPALWTDPNAAKVVKGTKIGTEANFVTTISQYLISNGNTTGTGTGA